MVEPRVPRVIEYTRAVFAKMVEEADEDGIWEGKMTELHISLGVPNNYYSKVTKIIAEYGADQLERGGAGRLSIWKIENPEADFSQAFSVKVRPKKRTLVHRVDDLEANVGGLNIPKLIADMGVEIEILKRQVSELSDRLGPRKETYEETA